jgi:molecular chaperone DnaK
MAKNPGVQDPRTDPLAFVLLKSKSQEIKEQLSSLLRSSIILKNLVGDKTLNESISRPRFENLINDMVEQCTDPIDTAIQEAHLTKDDITHLIMIGGSSRIPIIQEKLKEYFDNRLEPLSAVNPDHAIAIGACMFSQKLFGEGTKIQTICDVQPMSLGVNVKDDRYLPIIKRNSKLPQNQTSSYVTVYDNQKSYQFVIYEGEDPIASKNISLGEFTFSGLPPRPAGEVRFTINMEVGVDGVLKVHA